MMLIDYLFVNRTNMMVKSYVVLPFGKDKVYRNGIADFPNCYNRIEFAYNKKQFYILSEQNDEHVATCKFDFNTSFCKSALFNIENEKFKNDFVQLYFLSLDFLDSLMGFSFKNKEKELHKELEKASFLNSLLSCRIFFSPVCNTFESVESIKKYDQHNVDEFHSEEIDFREEIIDTIELFSKQRTRLMAVFFSEEDQVLSDFVFANITPDITLKTPDLSAKSNDVLQDLISPMNGVHGVLLHNAQDFKSWRIAVNSLFDTWFFEEYLPAQDKIVLNKRIDMASECIQNHMNGFVQQFKKAELIIHDKRKRLLADKRKKIIQKRCYFIMGGIVLSAVLFYGKAHCKLY